MGTCYYVYGQQTDTLFDWDKGGWWLVEALSGQTTCEAFVQRGHAAWAEIADDPAPPDPYFTVVLTQLWKFCAEENAWQVKLFSDGDDEFYEQFPHASRVIAYDRFDVYQKAVGDSVRAGRAVIGCHLVGKMWPADEGRDFATLLLHALEPEDWPGLIVDLHGVSGAILIGSFFNAFLLRVCKHDWRLVPTARKIIWLVDYPFQAQQIAQWMHNWKAS